MATVGLLNAHIPFVAVHLTIVVPVVNPTIVLLCVVGAVMVPEPDTWIHEPEPIASGLPESVVVPTLTQTL